MKLPAILLCSFLLFSCATSEGALFESVIGADEEQKSESEQPTPGKPPQENGDTENGTQKETEEPSYEEEGIKVLTQPGDARVYIDNEYVGTGTVLVNAKPGTYRISVRREGYYSQTVWAQYEDGTLVVVSVSLDEITGYLFLEVEPADATATVNGQTVSQGVTELRIGTYGLRVRKFGYEQWQQSFTIRERSTTRISVVLQPAEFALSSLDVSRRVFNPNNPGRLGTTKVSFEVTSWGDGTLIVTDTGGEEVYSRPLSRFTTWDQSLEWNGIDSAGKRLPDGEYLITIHAQGENSQKVHTLSTTVTIDSSAVISFRSVTSGISGTLFSPLPSTLPAGSFQIHSGIIGHYDPALQAGRYPTFLAVRAGLGNDVELDLQGAVFVGPEEPLPFTGGVGFKLKLPDSQYFSLGATGKLTYVGNTSIDTFHNYTGLSVGGIAALKTAPLVLTFAPEIVISPYSVIYPKSSQSAAFNAWAYGRLGILGDFGSVSAGISGSVRTKPFARGFDVQPPYSAGAELHWLVPGTQLVLSGYFATEFDAVNYYYFMGGAGIGFIN